jgi:hypothetical protein
MIVSSDMWQQHLNATGSAAFDPTIVFTTESKELVKAQETFVAENNQQKLPFNFNFVTNTKDVHPDSGFMKEVGEFLL